ncbi:MAG: helix-turn-helix domain-containing protein [Ruminococcaceae bacterium]|nr:helix-turn-helix domain-containing protein [Oscillospiraceae bacterium]
MQYDCPKFKIIKSLDISSISSIHYFEFSDDFVDTLESHEQWELVYIDRGECDIVADGNTFLLKQGEMYFHKPYEKHMLKTVKGIAPNIFIITFSSSSVATSYFEDKKIHASMSIKQHISAIIHEASSTFDLPFNTPDMQGLKIKENDSLWGGPQSVFLRLELMLIEIIRENSYYTEQKKIYFPKDIIEDGFVLKIISFMEKHLYGHFTMSELSRELSFGKTYISKYFSKVSGYSVMNYFTMMKINEAKRLIRETPNNFSEISEMLMFTNSHYFSSVFKKYTGMTPSQYKKSCTNI